MKIIFFGTSEFAVPALRALVKAKYDIVAVVTQPDKPAGRKQEPLPSPVKLVALELGLEVLQPPHLTSPTLGGGMGSGASLPLVGRAGEGVDLFIVASYGKIIPKRILDLPKFGTLNIHPSLLPKYRGPSPIQTAILNGDKETGVTIMKLDEEMDHGDIVASEKLKVKSRKFKEVHDELAEVGAKLLIRILPKYISGEIEPVQQDHAKATFTKMIAKDDGRIDWSKSAVEIDCQVRAFSDWPVAWTTLDGKRLKIFSCSLLPWRGEDAQRAGEVAIKDNKLMIQTRNGQLEIAKLQTEGGRVITAKDFINGNPRLSGKVLI